MLYMNNKDLIIKDVYIVLLWFGLCFQFVCFVVCVVRCGLDCILFNAMGAPQTRFHNHENKTGRNVFSLDQYIINKNANNEDEIN